MKKIFLLIAVALMSVSAAFAQNLSEEADFSSVCSSGQVLHYKVVDYGEVYVWGYFQYPEMLGGFIQVPRTVRHNDQNYVVTGIADSAFANCIRVQGVTLPNTMFYLGDKAFFNCTDLRVIEMPKTLVSIGERCFEGCTSLIDVVMPNAVVDMGDYAFRNCTGVRHFVISHSLTYIPEGCFEGCSSVTDYIIPASIDTIYCHAFDGYKQLRNVSFMGDVPPTPSCSPTLPFSRTIPISVPRRSFDTYKASYIWGQYKIQAM